MSANFEISETYKGYDLHVLRAENGSGVLLTDYSIIRVSDGFLCHIEQDESIANPGQCMAMLKREIDQELASEDPWNERANAEFAEINHAF